MKKTKLITLLGLSVLLAGCGTKASDTTPIPTSAASDAASDTASDEVSNHELTVNVSGTKKVGETVTFIAMFDGSPVSPQSSVTYSCSDADAMDITANKATLKKAGNFDVTAIYTYENVEYKIVVAVSVEEDAAVTYSKISEVRALAENGKYTEVYVKGVIVATSGTSAFLADETGGIYIYNFYFQNTDTACSNYSWVLGSTVEIHCYVTAYNGAAQLTYSYKDDSSTYHDLDGRYANLSSDIMDAPEATELDETGLKALTADDTGKMYKFVAKYQSGSVSTSAKSYLNFTVGDTSIQLATDGSTSKAYDKKISELKAAFDELGLVEGDEVEIVAPFYSAATTKYAATFSYLSQGVSLTKHIEKDTLYINYTGDTKKGQTLTFSASYNGETVTDVTYTATKGADLVSITDNTVALTGLGDVTIQGSYTDNGTAKTAEVSFTVASGDPVAINTIVSGNDYYVKGVVSGTSTKGFTVTDSTGTIYVHMNATPTFAVGDSVSVEGSVSTYNGCVQFNTPEVTKLDDALDITVPAAVELTSTIADGFVKTTDSTVTDIVKYKWTSTVSKSSGNYFLLNVDGSSTAIEYSYYAGTLVSGNTYEFEGYYLGYNTKYKYATVLLTSATEKAPTEVSVKLDKTTASVEVGKTTTLTATVKLPEGTTDSSVTWESDNTDVATVENGTVTGVAEGTANITVTSVADTTKKATCAVTVNKAVDGDTVTINFDANFNKDFTTISTTEVTKTVDGITMTWLKNSSTNNIALNDNNDALAYVNPIRVYKGHTVEFDAGSKKIAKITTTSASDKQFKGANVTSDSGTVGTDEVTFDTTVGTVTFTFANQVRLNSISFVLVD